jgi:opacity protein-like surface antigen
MRDIHHALIAAAVIALAALTASAADAQYAAYGYSPYAGTYYSYGANRANPSLAPNGWDLGNPRDFQLQGR